MAALACDFGGTRIKVGLVESGELVATAILPAVPGEAMPSTMERVADELENLCRRNKMAPTSSQGIAMAFPALVDTHRGRVLDHFGKYRDAPDFDFNHWIAGLWGIPLSLENDARLALIGEWQHGAGRGCDQLAVITLGTGIGTAVLLDGVPLRGPRYAAGNLGGQMPMTSIV